MLSATKDRGQYKGILDKINEKIKSINDTTGKTYCNKKKHVKSNFFKFEICLEINNGQ